MAGRLSRFLNLEQRRPQGDADPRLPSTEQRFRPSPEDPAAGHPAPGGPAAGHQAGDEEAALESLRRERAQRLASGVELAETSDAEQPFRRCALCEMDNNRAAARCLNCGADLTTGEQRDFNAHLWAQRREELAREQAELAAAPHGAPAAHDPLGLRRASSRYAAGGGNPVVDELGAGGAPSTGTRALGESLARHAALEEEGRLSSLGDGPWTSRWTRPLGWILIGAIEPPWLQLAAKLGVLGFAALLVSLAADAQRPGASFNVPTALLVGLALLFVPRWRRRGPFGWWR